MESLPSATCFGDTNVNALGSDRQSQGQGLPNYIQPLTCSTTDWAELQRHEALTLPPVSLRNRILRAFADFVYPCMPIVQLQRIIRAIDNDDGQDPVHLLLFQAIMFSGVAHVEPHHLQSHGYYSHRYVRRLFFERLESCYEIFTKSGTDVVVLIQALLLMTFWYDSSTDCKDSYHWMRIILSLSRAAGMYDDDKFSTNLNPSDRRLRRRLAWFTFVRDRMILLGARRPASIDAAEFKLQPLTVDDFELDPLETTGQSCLPDDCKLFRDALRLRSMATLCVHRTRLSLHIDYVATLHQELMAKKDAQASVPPILTCSSKLQAWWAEVLAQDDQCAHPWLAFRHGEESSMIQRSMLYLTYCAIISALHRPLARIITDNNLQISAHLRNMLEHSSTTALNKATSDTTRLAGHLYRLGLWVYLPATAVTSLLSAIIRHLNNVGSSDIEVKESSLLGFSQCLRLIGQLQVLWDNAGDVCAFLDTAIGEIRSSSEQQTYEVMELSNIVDSVRRSCVGSESEVERSPPTYTNGETAWMPQPESQTFEGNVGNSEPDYTYFGDDETPIPDLMSPMATFTSTSFSAMESDTAFDINDLLRFDHTTDATQSNNLQLPYSEKGHFWTSAQNNGVGGLFEAI